MTETYPRDAETQSLLLEVGCEEIPARFLAQAQRDLGERLRSGLSEARLLPGEPVEIPPAPTEGTASDSGLQNPQCETFSTPRRLVVHVAAVLDRQPDLTEEVVGPPVKVALDKDGKLTRAAESFAAKNAATVENLYRVTTAKGEYLAVKKTTYGRPALEVLREVLPAVITGMSFPKSMYWEGSKTRFVRPIRWLLALLGEDQEACVIPFEVAGVGSGRLTYGHRVAGGTGITVTGFRDYATKLRAAYVELDSESRRQAIRSEINVLLEDWHDDVVPDQGLEDWIVNSTEWLSGIRGGFDERFLRLPREILVTVMRDYQKYFAVQDGEGKLRPHFISLLNRDRDLTGWIQAGHERVLAARFADAEFFWNADQKIPLRDRLPMLERVTYQAKLGSYGDKVRRMEAIARGISQSLALEPRQESDAMRAAKLAKCDLTTQMVQEFTELQGIVGGLYASAQEEPEAVAEAIYDHYLPLGMNDRCPRALPGAVVSLADKFDAVVGGFAAELAPTGSSDPFSLRRQANGIVKIMIELSMPVRVSPIVDSCANVLHEQQSRLDPHGLRDKILAFFEERLRYYLQDVKGFPYDTVRAVLAPVADEPLDAMRRAQAIQEIRGSEDFIAVCAAAKRVRNILAKSASDSERGDGEVDESRLKEEEEKELYRECSGLSERQLRYDDPARYQKFLRSIAGLRPTVDRFFDKVLVMDADAELRRNRLRLLARLDQQFSKFAHLSEIVT